MEMDFMGRLLFTGLFFIARFFNKFFFTGLRFPVPFFRVPLFTIEPLYLRGWNNIYGI